MLPTIVFCDQEWIRLDSLHFAIFTKTIEKEAFATAHVENPTPVSFGSQSLYRRKNEALPSTPPPVLLVELAIVECVFRVHLTATHDLADNIVRPAFGFFVHPAEILANNTQKEELNTGKESHDHNQCRETWGRLTENDSYVCRIRGIYNGTKNRQQPKNSGDAQGDDRKSEDPVKCQS